MDNLHIVLPPGPRCAVCLHVLCPCCPCWCDVMIHRTETTEDYEAGDVDTCCDGRCIVDPVSLYAWRVLCADAFEVARDRVASFEVAEGPEHRPAPEPCEGCGLTDCGPELWALQRKCCPDCTHDGGRLGGPKHD